MGGETSVIDAVGVLANNPDHRGLCLRVVERVEVLAQRPDHRLVPVQGSGFRVEGLGLGGFRFRV